LWRPLLLAAGVPALTVGISAGVAWAHYEAPQPECWLTGSHMAAFVAPELCFLVLLLLASVAVWRRAQISEPSDGAEKSDSASRQSRRIAKAFFAAGLFLLVTWVAFSLVMDSATQIAAATQTAAAAFVGFHGTVLVLLFYVTDPLVWEYWAVACGRRKTTLPRRSLASVAPLPTIVEAAPSKLETEVSLPRASVLANVAYDAYEVLPQPLVALKQWWARRHSSQLEVRTTPPGTLTSRASVSLKLGAASKGVYASLDMAGVRTPRPTVWTKPGDSPGDLDMPQLSEAARRGSVSSKTGSQIAPPAAAVAVKAVGALTMAATAPVSPAVAVATLERPGPAAAAGDEEVALTAEEMFSAMADNSWEGPRMQPTWL
jgi:hypothetical protein